MGLNNRMEEDRIRSDIPAGKWNMKNRSNSRLINAHGINPKGGDVRQSRKQEEKDLSAKQQRKHRETSGKSEPWRRRPS